MYSTWYKKATKAISDLQGKNAGLLSYTILAQTRIQ